MIQLPQNLLRAAASVVALGSRATFATATCRLALVLAIDFSNSVDACEDALQRNGLANTLIAPEAQKAMFLSDFDVALAVFESSGQHQDILFDWDNIDSPAFRQPRLDPINVVRITDLGVDTNVVLNCTSHVLHGPGTFVEVADQFEGYERAMRRKLQRELAPAMIGALPPNCQGNV